MYAFVFATMLSRGASDRIHKRTSTINRGNAQQYGIGTPPYAKPKELQER